MDQLEQQNLTVRVEEQPNLVTIFVAGSIDEQSTFSPPDLQGRPVVVDVHDIEKINSMGVRSWIGFMKLLHSSASEVIVRRLPPIMVLQASMITNFLGNSRVESFMTPWFCPDCEHNLDQQHGYADPIPEGLECPECKSVMELDWDRDAYLAFRQE